VVPLGLGVALLAAFSRGYLRWGAAAASDDPENLEGETLALARIAELSRIRREALEPIDRADWAGNFNRETPPKGRFGND
jgi:hypothetical protein